MTAFSVESIRGDIQWGSLGNIAEMIKAVKICWTADCMRNYFMVLRNTKFLRWSQRSVVWYFIHGNWNWCYFHFSHMTLRIHNLSLHTMQLVLSCVSEIDCGENNLRWLKVIVHPKKESLLTLMWFQTRITFFVFPLWNIKEHILRNIWGFFGSIKSEVTKTLWLPTFLKMSSFVLCRRKFWNDIFPFWASLSFKY